MRGWLVVTALVVLASNVMGDGSSRHLRVALCENKLGDTSSRHIAEMLDTQMEFDDVFVIYSCKGIRDKWTQFPTPLTSGDVEQVLSLLNTDFVLRVWADSLGKSKYGVKISAQSWNGEVRWSYADDEVKVDAKWLYAVAEDVSNALKNWSSRSVMSDPFNAESQALTPNDIYASSALSVIVEPQGETAFVPVELTPSERKRISPWVWNLNLALRSGVRLWNYQLVAPKSLSIPPVEDSIQPFWGFKVRGKISKYFALHSDLANAFDQFSIQNAHATTKMSTARSVFWTLHSRVYAVTPDWSGFQFAASVGHLFAQKRGGLNAVGEVSFTLLPEYTLHALDTGVALLYQEKRRGISLVLEADLFPVSRYQERPDTVGVFKKALGYHVGAEVDVRLYKGLYFVASASYFAYLAVFVGEGTRVDFGAKIFKGADVVLSALCLSAGLAYGFGNEN